MNAMNSLVEQVLEASKGYFAQAETRDEPVGRGQLARPEKANYVLSPGNNLRTPDSFVAVLETYPHGIRELTSPLSD